MFIKRHTINELPNYLDKNNICFISTDDIKKIAKPLFEKFGLTYFAHSISWHDGYATTLITEVDVIIYWVVEQFFLPGSNPGGPRMLSGTYFVPALDEIYPIPYRKALNEVFHIDNMLMIVENYPGRDDFFSFATEPDHRKIVNAYFNNLDVFRRFIANYKIQADGLIKQAIKTRVPIPLSSSVIETDLGTLPAQEKRILLGQLTPKRIPLSNGSYLTTKEVDCLLWGSGGKSAKEIAKILAVSPRTVEMHLENAKEKLDCSRKSQLFDAFLKIADQYDINKDFIKSND